MSIDDLIDLIDSPKPGATPAELDRTEQSLGFALAPELRSLLSVVNGGGIPLDSELPLPDGSVAAGFELLAASEIPDATALLLRGGDHASVFARDGFGNALVCDTADRVFFFDHDTGQLLDLRSTVFRLPELFRSAPSPSTMTAATLWPQGAPLEGLINEGAAPSDFQGYLEAASRDDFDAYLYVAVSHGRADVVAQLFHRWPGSNVPPHAVWLASSSVETATLACLLDRGADPTRVIRRPGCQRC